MHIIDSIDGSPHNDKHTNLCIESRYEDDFNGSTNNGMAGLSFILNNNVNLNGNPNSGANSSFINEGQINYIAGPGGSQDGEEQGNLQFMVSDKSRTVSEVMRLCGGTSRVGIGITNPSDKLQVNGTTRSTYFKGYLKPFDQIGTTHPTTGKFDGFNIRFNRCFDRPIGQSTTGNGFFCDSIQLPKDTWGDHTGGGATQICISKTGSIRMILKRAKGGYLDQGIPYNSNKLNNAYSSGSVGALAGSNRESYVEVVTQDAAGKVGIGGQPDYGYYLTVHGNLLSTGTITPSDIRIKTDIENVPDNLALHQIKSLECKYYHYIDPERRKKYKTIGFIQRSKKLYLMQLLNQKM